MKKINLIFYLFQIFLLISCSGQAGVRPGAMQTGLYFKRLAGKSFGIVANQGSVIGNKHLVDSLIAAGYVPTRIFSPEHGFRGTADAGEELKNSVDPKSGIEVVSLYGDHKKPKPSDLSGIDLMIFDLQDVGVRFYTYISSLHYVMEACAEAGIPVIVLDRPNPNAFYIDGPVLEEKYKSFVGMHPVPVVYGMTIGEYALMINGEGWLKNEIQCKLSVVPCENYTHQSKYSLPVAPSPNLRNDTAIVLYPSLCFFEGTIMSIGRGTDFPFMCFGHPDFGIGSFVFTPLSGSGSKHPKYEGQACYGFGLSNAVENIYKEKQLELNWLIGAHQFFKGEEFFNSYFEKLAGTEMLRKQIDAGLSEEEIRKSWKPGLEKFRQIRNRYLLYAD